MGNDTQSQSQTRPQPKAKAPKPVIRLSGPQSVSRQQFAVQFTENSEGLFPVTNGYITGSFVECEGELTVGHGPGKAVVTPTDAYLAQSTMLLSKELQEALKRSGDDPSRGSNPFYYVIFEGVLSAQAGINLTIWARDYEVLAVELGTSLGSRIQEEAVNLASQNSTAIHETKRQQYLVQTAPSSFQDILGQALRKGLKS